MLQTAVFKTTVTNYVPQYEFLGTEDKSLSSFSRNDWKAVLEMGKPDYLINHSTFTCITVRRGTCPDDAEVGMAVCTGGPRQQWIYQGGMWQWAANRSYCLAAVDNAQEVCLVACEKVTKSWVLDDQGRLVFGNLAMDVPWEEPRITLYMHPMHGGDNQKWWKLSDLESTLISPEIPQYPIPVSDGYRYKQEVARGLINRLTPVSRMLQCPRNVHEFPGSVAPFAPRIGRHIFLDLTHLGQDRDHCMTVPEDWLATNMYVVAGEICTVCLPHDLSPKRAEQIVVRVGAQCDIIGIGSPNVIGRDKMIKRMPIVTEVFGLVPGVNHIRSQYGGNLIFIFTEGENFTVTAFVSNVVETPHFKLGESKETSWLQKFKFERPLIGDDELSKVLPPYCILESMRVVLVVPTDKAIKSKSLTLLLFRYDDVIKKLDDFAGFDHLDPPPRGKFWLVDDIQISAGNAHAGFPAMFERNLYDLTLIDTPYDWVIWHELGHNYQQIPYWSHIYGAEATAEVTASHLQDMLRLGDRLSELNEYLRAAEAVDYGLAFQNCNPFQQAVFLLEIKNAFPEKGWRVFSELYRATRRLSNKAKKHLAKDPQLQYEFVYRTLSCDVGFDLSLHFVRWGIPISESEISYVQKNCPFQSPADLSRRTRTDIPYFSQFS